MSVSAEWVQMVRQTMTDMASTITTVRLYGVEHGRATAAIRRFGSQLHEVFTKEPELTFVLLGEELFVQGHPFTRNSRQAPALIRRFRRRGIEHLSFRQGMTESELANFLRDLASSDDSPMRTQDHIPVGKVELSEREFGGPDSEQGGKGKRNLPTLRDRVSLVEEIFTNLAEGRELAVGDLEKVARAVHDNLGLDPDPLHQFAPWEGEQRWLAVHAHNTCVLTVGLARFAGVGSASCVDLGVAALVHDIGKLSFPPDVISKELELTGDELELILDHPRIGLETLLLSGQITPLALIVALEHHLNFNGTGYPRLGRPRRPHPASRLISLADAFVILLTARGGRGMMTREGTLAWLADHEGTVFDPGWTIALREIVDRSEPLPPPFTSVM